MLDPLAVHPRGRPVGALNQRDHGGIAVERTPRKVDGRGGRAEQGIIREKKEHKAEEAEDKGEGGEYKVEGVEQRAPGQVYEEHDKILLDSKVLMFSYLL